MVVAFTSLPLLFRAIYSKMSLICYDCNSCYNKKFNLKRHIITTHLNDGSEKENNKKRQKRRILCSECNSKFDTFSNYHYHLKIRHNITLNKTNSTFSNMSEFRKWKMDFEKETSSTFVQTSSAKTMRNRNVVYYFFCHRSFLGKKHIRKTKNQEKSGGSSFSGKKRIRKRKNQGKDGGSVKIEKSCPAMMKAVVVTNGTVEVQFCSTHLGHECDITRLRLSTEDKNLLAEKLSTGVPPGRILEDIRRNAPLKKDRIHFIDIRDLYNIKRDCQIACPLQYNNNDRISVESWIKEKENLPKANNPVLFYKDQDSDCENFEKFDFILILMTEFQKQRMVQFGEKVICVDATHVLNNYNFQMFTILVLDEYDEGIPIAFCFSNKSTKEVYKLFFSQVKKAINKSILTNVFMSDGEMTFYDAWKEIMAPATHQLICRWHLNKIWVTNLKKITNAEKRKLVLQTLNSLIMEKNVDEFTQSFDQFLVRLQMDPETTDFYKYFNKNYVDNVCTWAQCYCMDVPIHTNMGLEALHKNIKYNYLNGTRCIRLDRTIYALMCLIQDKEFERLIKFTKQKPSKKLAQIKRDHEKSVECDENVEVLGGEKWLVRSSTNPSLRYQVNLVKYEPCCVHICKKCKICLHMLVCSCHDYSVKQNICKHIHSAMRLQQQKKENDVSPEEFQDLIFRSSIAQNHSSTGLEIEQSTNDDSELPITKKSEVLAKIWAISSAVETKILSNEQLSTVLKLLDDISAEIFISSSSKTPH